MVAASHGGRYSAHVALAAGVRAVILHEAGIGVDGAGIAGLGVLQAHRVPAAVVDSPSAVIGDVGDMRRRGRIGQVNDSALALGCVAGMTVREAVEVLSHADLVEPVPSPVGETRTALIESGPVPVWALDSASLVRPTDSVSVVVTGSHAQLLGGDPGTALKVNPVGALFNDAGVPADGPAGRIGVLGLRGIPAATVDAMTARIGDGRSTYFDGVVSRVNEPASALGARSGMRARDVVELIIERATVTAREERGIDE